MTPTQFQRVKTLYLELESAAPEERADRLARECNDDPEVHKLVANMLTRATVADDQILVHVGRTIERILASPVDPLAEVVGQRVGAYDVTSVLGRGGMGVVYRAHDTRLDRPAALKAVLPETSDREGYLLRFRREARVLASLSHPNIATVFGLEESHGALFLAMEFIEGKTLAERTARGPLTIELALQICEQVAAGVECAHDAGIIHRDLKPANIMLTREGVAKVLDFGLAREIEIPSGNVSMPISLTPRGSPVGTPAYMSPEQARGELLDERSDIFSFGAVLFKCLTGRSPFSGETMAEVIDAVLTRDPDQTLLPAHLPQSIHSILRRCLAKRPSDRYRHIGDVKLDLHDALLARQWEQRKPAKSKKQRLKSLIPWAAVLALAGALVMVMYHRAAAPVVVTQGSAQRFDLTLPMDSVQRDLERLQLALSPDGKSICVACQTTDGQALWIRSHHDGLWRRIEGTQDGHRPSFSRDGQWVYFYRNNVIYKQRVTGRGEPVRMVTTTNWYGATELDDGRLAYCPAWGAPLAVSAGDMNEKNVTQPNEKEISHISPCAIPGSNWMLYNAWFGAEECYVHATNLQTGESKRVVANASSGKVINTPRGDYLLFERSSIIFAAPFDRQNAKITGPEYAIAEGVLNDGTRFASYFDVADDGTLAYFPGSAFAEESRLAYVNPDGTSTPVNDDRMSFSEPGFSGDGSLMSVGIKGKVYRTLVINLKQKTREFIVTGGDSLSQSLSPDSKMIAVTVNREGGYGIDLFSLVNGGRIRRLVPPQPDYPSDLTFSRDGKYLAFAMSPAQGKPRDVYVIDLAGGSEPRKIVGTPAGDTLPSFSPDGKWLAYSSDFSGRSEVYLVSFPDTSVTRQITSTGGESPAWSPDGKKIYFIADRKLLSLDLTADGLVTGRSTEVYTQPFGQSDPLGKNFTVAPDGRVVVVEPSERRPSITHLHAITRWWELLPK